MNLYLKYRPKSLDDVVGNTNTIESLQSMIEKGLPHALLLTGPTGCGKTTIGRILAEEVGSIGSDFKEVDSADFRGIDTVREIRSKAQYSALEGSARVYLIDEVHQMTSAAQNALLKILEDTPKHVYFILCTTDPQKLLKTVKGRCQTFPLTTLEDSEMLSLIRRVTKAEGESLQKTVYKQIVLDSLGHPRNALQILDKVLSVDEDSRLDVAKQQAEKENQSIELCQALIQGKGWGTVADILKGLKKEDPEGIRRQVLGYAGAVALNGKDPERMGLVLESFSDPYYDTNFAGLVLSCLSVLYN